MDYYIKTLLLLEMLYFEISKKHNRCSNKSHLPELTDNKCLCVATKLNFMDYHIKTLLPLEMLYFEISNKQTQQMIQ